MRTGSARPQKQERGTGQKDSEMWKLHVAKRGQNCPLMAPKSSGTAKHRIFSDLKVSELREPAEMS